MKILGRKAIKLLNSFIWYKPKNKYDKKKDTINSLILYSETWRRGNVKNVESNKNGLLEESGKMF